MEKYHNNSAMTVKDAAEQLGYCPATIRSYIKSGLLRAMKQKKEYRIFPEALQEFQTKTLVVSE